MRKRKLIIYIQIAIMVISVTACSSKKPREQGYVIQRDSCLIKIMAKPNSKKTNATAAVESENNSDTLVDLIVSFQTEKHLEKQDNQSELIFGMDKKFGLICDTAFQIPVFCQPIATGNSQKYAYWVSFEVDKKVFNKGKNEMVILSNRLIKDSIHYKIL